MPFAVIVAAGHLAKGLAKIVSWAPFLPRALHDPSGAATARALVAKTAPSPAAWLPLGVVAVIGLALVVATFSCAGREARLAAPVSGVRAPTPRLALVALIAGWALG